MPTKIFAHVYWHNILYASTPDKKRIGFQKCYLYCWVVSKTSGQCRQIWKMYLPGEVFLVITAVKFS